MLVSALASCDTDTTPVRAMTSATLRPQQRNVGGVRAVRGRRVETEEAVLAADLAGGVVALDPDVVHVAGAVHRRSRVRLGQDQQVLRPRVAAQRRRQLREALRAAALLATQHAQRRAVDDRQRVAVVGRDQVVAAVAEEGEVTVGEPRQEGPGLGDLGRRPRRRAAAELADDVGDARAHRAPVVDADAHVGEHTLEVGGERLHPLGVGDAVDLDVHQRLARATRRVGGASGPGAIAASAPSAPRSTARIGWTMRWSSSRSRASFHRHRIDEERHVVVDDLDHRVRRLPAVVVELRVEHAQLRGRPAAARPANCSSDSAAP